MPVFHFNIELRCVDVWRSCWLWSSSHFFIPSRRLRRTHVSFVSLTFFFWAVLLAAESCWTLKTRDYIHIWTELELLNEQSEKCSDDQFGWWKIIEIKRRNKKNHYKLIHAERRELKSRRNRTSNLARELQLLEIMSDASGWHNFFHSSPKSALSPAWPEETKELSQSAQNRINSPLRPILTFGCCGVVKKKRFSATSRRTKEEKNREA